MGDQYHSTPAINHTLLTLYIFAGKINTIFIYSYSGLNRVPEFHLIITFLPHFFDDFLGVLFEYINVHEDEHTEHDLNNKNNQQEGRVLRK